MATTKKTTATKAAPQANAPVKKEVAKRTFTGTVVSSSMNKTITVRVDSMKMNEKYQKTYRVSSKFPVHDEKNSAKVGDVVHFVETRPLSKTKRWKLVDKK